MGGNGGDCGQRRMRHSHATQQLRFPDSSIVPIQESDVVRGREWSSDSEPRRTTVLDSHSGDLVGEENHIPGGERAQAAAERLARCGRRFWLHVD